MLRIGVLKSKGLGSGGLLVNQSGEPFGMLRKPLKISDCTLRLGGQQPYHYIFLLFILHTYTPRLIRASQP